METIADSVLSRDPTAFRPSYEGWKQSISHAISRHARLLDLPMRDGNCRHRQKSTYQGQPFRPSNEGWKLSR